MDRLVRQRMLEAQRIARRLHETNQQIRELLPPGLDLEMFDIHSEDQEPVESVGSTDIKNPAGLAIVKPRSISNPSAAAQVKEHIRQHGLIYETFAAKAGISLSALNSLISTGSASPTTWAAVAGAMPVEVSELLRPKTH